MPSLIQQLAQATTQSQLAPTQRKRVVVYAPGRGLPQAPVRQQQRAGPRQQPSGTRPLRTGSASGGEAIDRAEQAFLNSPEAQKQREEKAQKEAEDAAWDEQPWYKKGLGMVIGNPIVSNVLKPLGVISTLGKTVTAGLEEVAERTNVGELPAWAKTAMLFNPATAVAGIAAQVDTERTEADDRNIWEKIKPDSDYGFGQLLDPDLSPWISRPAGFLGDIALDPTTYVTGGATRIAGGIEKAGKLSKAAQATKLADNFFDDAARHAAAGNIDEVGKAARLGAEQEAIARRFTEQAATASTKKVPLRQGRRGREAFAAELAEHNPELLATHADELARAGERGFNTVKDPFLREQLGLNTPQLRMMGVDLPGTQRLVQRTADVGGAIRPLMNKAPIIGKVGAKFTPQGLEEPSAILSRGAKGDVLRAATTVRIQNLMRRGAGSMEGRGNKALTDMVRQLRELGGEDEIRALVRQAETDPEKNIFNKFFGEKLPELYEKVSGRRMEVTRDRNTYIPHMHTPEGRRFLASLDPDMVERDLGFVQDDLLEGSKFLEKSRKLAPDTPGKPKEFQIGDRGTITLTDGTIDELNSELGRLFPEFKGKFYQDDPVKIGEAYVSSVARQAGRDLALDRLAASDNPLVREITGELLESVETRNKFLRQNPIVEKVKAGYTAGQRLAPIKAKGDMPITPHDDLFAVTKHVAETQAQRDYMMKQGKEYVAEVGKDVTKTRSTLVENLKSLRTTLKDGLKRKAKDADEQIVQINKDLSRIDMEIQKLGPLNSQNVDETVAMSATIDAQIATTRHEIKKLNDRYGKKIPRDLKRAEAELNKTLRRLTGQRETLERNYSNGTAAMRAEARARREALEAPVNDARKVLDQAEAKVGPPPVTRQQVQEANVHLRQDFESEDFYEADRQLYFDELNRMRDEGIPIQRTIDGKLTPETAAAVQVRVAEAKKLPPAPTPEQALREAMARQAAGAPPPAAVVPEAAPETGVAGGAGGLPAPEAPPAPAAVPPSPEAPPPLVNLGEGKWSSDDGFAITKQPSGSFKVTFGADDDFGNFKTLAEAKAHLAHEQEVIARTRASRQAAEAEDLAARAATPEVTPSPAPEPAAATPAAETKPTTQRLRRNWKKSKVNGRDIETGPEGWTIEPFEESIKLPPKATAKGYIEPKAPGPRMPVAPMGDVAEGPRRLRYVALDTYPEGHPLRDALRNRSFASPREAKLAVQDALTMHAYEQTFAERMAAYQATTLDREIPVHSRYEDLAGVVAPTPGPTPKEAAANRARVQGVPNQERPVAEPGPLQGPLEPTPEGLALEAMRPEEQPRNIYPPGVQEWQVKFDEWQRLLAQSKDPNLTKTARDEAGRKARSLGGEFTQKSGKYYSTNAAQKVMIDDIAWQIKRDADPAYVAAKQNYEREVRLADQQVEALVYTKHHNPETGLDEHTRLPAGSETGFLGEAERVPVLPRPPEQGQVPMGTATEMPRAPSRAGYSQGQRDADRALIESGLPALMPGENQEVFDNLTTQAQGIAERLDNAARNEDELARLDQVAQQAYTSEVKLADDAVKAAKTAEENARLNVVEGNVPGAGGVWEEAKRATKRAVDNQTEKRQAWMAADRAWKDALEVRDTYMKAQAEVTSAERALFAERQDAEKFIDAARLGEPTPQVPSRKGGHEPAPKNVRDFSDRLRKAYYNLDQMDAAGLTHLTDVERRDLAGNLVGIDKSKRDLLNQMSPERQLVRPAEAILPSPEPPVPKSPENVRLGKYETATGIPPVRETGQSDLAARAYAESFEPTEPAAEGITTAIEKQERDAGQLLPGTQEVMVERPQQAPRQAYHPRTEREAITELETKAEGADALNAPLQRERAKIAGKEVEAQETHDAAVAVAEKLRDTQRDELLPLKDKAATLVKVNDALHRKEKLIPLREEAIAQGKQVLDTKVTKNADLVVVADDIGKVARQNPDLFDDDMAVTEAILQDARDEATRVNQNDLTASQVQGVINKIGTKDDQSLDIMLTTVGQNWKMLYDSYGDKRAVLQENDIILQADLHRNFQNLYEIKKDKVLFGRTLNALTNLFKTYATLSPGFHVRNALSAMFMNATDGVGLKTQLSAARIWREYMGAEDSETWLKEVTSLHGFSGDEIRNAFDATHGSGAGGRFTEAGFAERLDTGHWSDKLGGLQRNKVTRFSQRVGERVEGSVRLAMGLDSARAGESIEASIQRINRVHFDYGEISTMDANMKRIVPFWTFMSRNMPMQVSQMWTHPQVYLGYQRFVRNFSSANEEYTPEYWTKAGAWNTGLKVPDFVPESFGGGLPISVQPDLGFTRLESDLKDYEDFLSGKRLGGVLSAGNPLYTAPVEYATRTDLFTGQQFEEGETVPVGGIMSPVKWLAQALGRTEGGEVDAAFMNAFRAVNPIADRETRLLPQVTGGDPEAIKRQGESIARFFGVPGRVLTPKQQDNEFFRRYYDQLDAAKLAQKRAQRQAG